MALKFRTQLKPSDIKPVREILRSTGFFYEFEIDTAIELVEANIQKGGKESGYYIILAEEDRKPVGYCCYGSTPCTVASYDLYWIAVHQSFANKGTGKSLLKMTEDSVVRMGGKNIWVETASRDQYAPTRIFYERAGYMKIAELPDFYAPGDNKVIFLKKV